MKFAFCIGNGESRKGFHISKLNSHGTVYGANAIFEANGEEKKIFEEERQVLAWARESVVTEKDIEKGDILNKQNVWVKRPGPGNEFIPAKDYTKVLGKTALKEIKKDTQIKWQDISD